MTSGFGLCQKWRTFATHIPDALTYDNPGAREKQFDPKSVRPIKMEESVRKYVSRRLLALTRMKSRALMTAMRQVERKEERHWLYVINSSLMSGKRDRSLVWSAVRNTVVTAWKHLALSRVEKACVEATPKDRGAEQGKREMGRLSAAWLLPWWRQKLGREASSGNHPRDWCGRRYRR